MLRSRMCPRWGALVALVWLGWWGSGGVAEGVQEGPPPSGAGHLERPEDPPLRVSPAERVTSPGVTVVRGNHVSVQVNVDAAGNNILGDAANEPSIAVDPTDPANIVIGWRQFDTVTSNFRQAGYAYSHDGGSTWTFPGVLQPGQFRSDPVLAADSQGRFFYYSLSSTTTAEMFFSDDKGVTWNGPIPAHGGDKTWMAIDTSGGIGEGHVYTTWNSQFTCCAPGTDYTRSTDRGLTYEGPYATPSKPKWGTLAVGPDGELYLVGTRITALSFPLPHLLLRSTSARDPAQTPTFELVTGLDLGGETITGGTPNPGGLMGQVWVAVDASSGPTRGYVYVLASVDPAGADPLDVMFARSADRGETFTPPVRVNDDPPGSNAWQWFGTMSVAPDGRIDVVWNDTRHDPSGEVSEVFYAYSTDAGKTWSKGLPVTPPWNSLVGHPNQNKIGDYYHMVSDARGGMLAYSATFNGEQDVWFLRVGDCNANGTHDSQDIASGASEDCDRDGIPDECEEEPVVCLDCDNDGVCEQGEDCTTCPNDCISGSGGCGNGICEPALGEDCLSCASDCAGRQKGNPANRFCCGDGDGETPVGCSDLRCSTTGQSCSDLPAPPSCCGDGVCEGVENSANCRVDCGGAPFCGDGSCDVGEDCRSCPGDCEGKTGGKPENRFCCGDGTVQPAEGDGSRCDGNF